MQQALSRFSAFLMLRKRPLFWPRRMFALFTVCIVAAAGGPLSGDYASLEDTAHDVVRKKGAQRKENHVLSQTYKRLRSLTEATEDSIGKKPKDSKSKLLRKAEKQRRKDRKAKKKERKLLREGTRLKKKAVKLHNKIKKERCKERKLLRTRAKVLDKLLGFTACQARKIAKCAQKYKKLQIKEKEQQEIRRVKRAATRMKVRRLKKKEKKKGKVLKKAMEILQQKNLVRRPLKKKKCPKKLLKSLTAGISPLAMAKKATLREDGHNENPEQQRLKEQAKKALELAKEELNG